MIYDYTSEYLCGSLNHEFDERNSSIGNLNKRAENIEKRHKKKFALKKQDLTRWFK